MGQMKINLKEVKTFVEIDSDKNLSLINELISNKEEEIKDISIEGLPDNDESFSLPNIKTSDIKIDKNLKIFVDNEELVDRLKELNAKYPNMNELGVITVNIYKCT